MADTHYEITFITVPFWPSFHSHALPTVCPQSQNLQIEAQEDTAPSTRIKMKH